MLTLAAVFTSISGERCLLLAASGESSLSLAFNSESPVMPHANRRIRIRATNRRFLETRNIGTAVAHVLWGHEGCQSRRRDSADQNGAAMKPNADLIVRVLKRLKAAVGYHELGLTPHALRCLDSLSSLGKIGPFGLVAEILRDEFLKGTEEHLPAAKALGTAACMLPTSGRNAIQMTLAACYGPSDTGRAVNNRPTALGVKLEGQPKPAC